MLFREESEKVSELKSVTGSSKLPYGTLASGSEGIREAITGFDDAYVFHCSLMELVSYSRPTAASRISRTNASPLNSLTRIPKREKPFCPPSPRLLPNLASHLLRFLQMASPKVWKRQYSPRANLYLASAPPLDHNLLRYQHLLVRSPHPLEGSNEVTRDNRAWVLL